jgi:hypothetical protein
MGATQRPVSARAFTELGKSTATARYLLDTFARRDSPPVTA